MGFYNQRLIRFSRMCFNTLVLLTEAFLKIRFCCHWSALFGGLALASSVRLCVNMFSFHSPPWILVSMYLQWESPHELSLLRRLTVLFFHHFEVFLPTWDLGHPSIPAILSQPLPQSSLGGPVTCVDWAFSPCWPGLLLPVCFADLHLSVIYVFRSVLQFTYSPLAIFNMLFI